MNVLIVVLSILTASCFNIEEFCEEFEDDTSLAGIPYVFREFEYPDPTMLTVEQMKTDIDERSEILLDFIAEGNSNHIRILPALIQRNVSFDFEEVVRTDLDCLQFFTDPDFNMLVLIRTLFMTREYDEEIIPVIETIPLWITPGEKTRIYWSENHIIMYAANAYLLRQMFGNDFGLGFDDGLDARLLWFLQTKPITGFFEFNSHIYSRFTLSALLNLYDFAEDSLIKDLAYDCIIFFFENLMKVTNSYGVDISVAGRVYTTAFSQCNGLSKLCEMYRNGLQEIASLATGIGPFLEKSELRLSTGFLALSSIDISPAIKTYTKEVSTTISIGLSKAELLKTMGNLSKQDQTVMFMSMGGYAHEDFIQDLFEFVDFYDMWEHDSFKDYAAIKVMPFSWAPFFSSIISGITKGSLYVAEDIKIYKNDQVIISSMNNFFGGFRTYQQFPWVIGVGNVSAYVVAMPLKVFNSSEAREQTTAHHQTPFMTQKENVALAVFNPNGDLGLLGLDPYKVLFFMEVENLDEVVDTFPGKWIFGRLEEGYMGVYRHCLSEGSGLVQCSDKQQVWMGLVGNNNTHGSFESFIDVTLGSTVSFSSSGRCVSVVALVDGQLFDDEFCSDLGNAMIALIVVLCCLIPCCCGGYIKCFGKKSFKFCYAAKNELKSKQQPKTIISL